MEQSLRFSLSSNDQIDLRTLNYHAIAFLTGLLLRDIIYRLTYMSIYDTRMDELVKAAKSLGDPQRVRVLNLLMQRECCVCQIMEVLEITQVNASRYCHALLDAGFLKVHKEGRWRHYRVDVDACSPSLRGILESVREAGRSDPVMLTDIQRLAHAAPGGEHSAPAPLAKHL